MRSHVLTPDFGVMMLNQSANCFPVSYFQSRKNLFIRWHLYIGKRRQEAHCNKQAGSLISRVIET